MNKKLTVCLLILTTSITLVAQTYRVGDPNYLYLRSGTDVNHGLAWFGTGKLFASEAVDGPVLFGYSAGVLGTKYGGDKKAIKWDAWGLISINGRLILPKANSTNNNSPGLIFEVNQNFLYDGEYLNYYGIGAHNYNDGGGLGTNLYLSGFYGIDFFTGGSQRLRIKTNGNIGIGTINPSEKLEIAHNDLSGGIVLNRLAGTSSKSEIKFSKNGNEIYAIGNDFNGDGTNIFFIWNQATSSAPFMINSQGKVSIGGAQPPTSASIYKLFVEGGIATRDIKVTAGAFPDFVFEKNYKLTPLDELEEYINTNHHLPQIPSLKEVESAGGYEIGNLQEKTLQKVEELTLYIIDLQKQIKALKDEVEILKKE